MPNNRKRSWSATASAVALMAVFALALCGCVRVKRNFASTKTSHSVTPGLQRVDSRMLVFRQRAEGKHAIFESDKVTLVFSNLKRRERNSFDGEDLAIQIAGDGRSETMRTCNRNGRVTTFRAVYANGVSTITFCGREVKLMDEARKVTVGGTTIDLSGGERVVTVLAQAE